MHVDWRRQEIIFKIVYYGPGLGGKTTNLEYLHRHLDPDIRSDLIMIKTREQRTLFFDFMELDLGRINGKKPRFHLYTLPGQAVYQHSRRVLMRGADAVVFVADSQPSRMEDNLNSLADLEQRLISMHRTLARFPWVLQYNKRDLPDIISVAAMQQALNFLTVPFYQAVASKGTGVIETLKGVITLLLQKQGGE
jgi:mutual gliding-motility protein MglA